MSPDLRRLSLVTVEKCFHLLLWLKSILIDHLTTLPYSARKPWFLVLMWMSHDPTHPVAMRGFYSLQSLAGLYGSTWRPGSGVSHYNITCLRLTGGEWLITAEVHHFIFSHCNFRIFLKRSFLAVVMQKNE